MRKQDTHISVCYAGERSVQTVPLAFWAAAAAAFPDFVVSVRVLCNNQKPLRTRQQELKPVIYLFHVSFVGEQFTPTARPHSGSPPVVEKSWVTMTKSKIWCLATGFLMQKEFYWRTSCISCEMHQFVSVDVPQTQPYILTVGLYESCTWHQWLVCSTKAFVRFH